jgi:hypothetical protein
MALVDRGGRAKLAVGPDAAGLSRHLFYWILPTLVSTGLVLAYFSGIEPLSNLVAPPLNREFGLLEHLQSAVLLITATGGVVGFRHAGNGVEKTISALVAAGAAFILLEEVDFGLHYWEYVFGETGVTNLNVHNQGGNLPVIKKASDVLVIVLFVLVPLAAWRLSDPRLTHFVPQRMIAITVLAGFTVSQFAHLLENAGLYPDGPLNLNVSEFRETFTYYAFMLFGLDLALRRRWPEADRKRG